MPARDIHTARQQRLFRLLLEAAGFLLECFFTQAKRSVAGGQLLDPRLMDLYQNRAIELEAALSSELANDWNDDEISVEEIDHQ